MKLVTRSALGWPASAAPAQATTDGTKVHYEGTAVSTRLLTDHTACLTEWKNIRTSHLANTAEGYSDIAYNYGACPHGYLLEGRGLGKRTGANGNQTLNRAHYAIVGLVGDSGLTQPTDAMLGAIRDGIELLRQHGAGNEIKGHRDGYATSCPGGPLYAWVKKGAPRPGGTTPEPPTASTYTVQDGDTLASIGRKFKVDWMLVAALNDIPAPYTIRPGQKLTIASDMTPKPPAKPEVDLSRVVAAAKTDPPKRGTPVAYAGVKTVEDALVAEGLLAKSLADGHFGTATRDAYALLQRRYGYSGKDADGIPGTSSLTRLGKAHGFTVTP